MTLTRRSFAKSAGLTLAALLPAAALAQDKPKIRVGVLRLASSGNVFIAADRAAWEDRPLASVPPGARTAPSTADAQRSVELISQLASLRKPTKSPNQLVHGDLYGTVLFAGTAAPGITDITPYWRPASWAAGVAVVDALSWGEADDGLIERWSSLSEWPQMLLRALMFRLAVHALHPRSTAAAFPGLARTAALVRLVL